MKRSMVMGVLMMALSAFAAQAKDNEFYTTLMRDEHIELRHYQPTIVAQVMVEGAFEEAGNKAFRTLADFIFGANVKPSGDGHEDIAMTAPVIVESANIGMTAPVLVEPMNVRALNQTKQQWAVQFLMPKQYTLDTLPRPTNPAISIRQLPAVYTVSSQFSGVVDSADFAKHQRQLKKYADDQKWQLVGVPRMAYYNSPFMPWFLRRNEVIWRVQLSPQQLAAMAQQTTPETKPEKKALVTEGMVVDQAYARATSARAYSGAAYVRLTNNTSQDDQLLRVETNVARAVELHTMTLTDGIMRMDMIRAIALPQGQTVALQPGGLHIMLLDLMRGLKAGEEIQLTLHFKYHAPIALSVPVQPLGYTPRAQ